MILLDSEEARIKWIIDNFDFKKVHDTVSYLGILWEEDQTPKAIPDIDTMKEACRNLLGFTLIKAKSNKSDTSFTIQGFKCSCDYKELDSINGSKNYLKLEYVIAVLTDTPFRLQDKILRKEKIETILSDETSEEE